MCCMENGIMSYRFNLLSDQYNFAVCYPTALIDGDGGSSGLNMEYKWIK